MRLKVHQPKTAKQHYLEEQQAKASLYWQDPPPANQRRMQAHLKLISPYLSSDMHLVDIGAGDRRFTDLLPCSVTACDAAPHPRCDHAILPYLPYQDHSFDGVICTDLLASIPQSLHRLSLSEIARLLPKKGVALFSTYLDQKSYDAREIFLELIQTEFEVMRSEQKNKGFFRRAYDLAVVARKKTFA